MKKSKALALLHQILGILTQYALVVAVTCFVLMFLTVAYVVVTGTVTILKGLIL